jgi:LDH2 family malate/lactate/ureidoglycolate dehydrogenase
MHPAPPILAWSIESFVPPETFAAHVGALLAAVRNSPPAEGFAEVLVPGEIEARTRAQRTRDGIPLSDGVWSELSALAARLGVPLPAAPA